MTATCQRCFAAPVREDIGICVHCGEHVLCGPCWDCDAQPYSCCLPCLHDAIDHQWAAMTPYGRAQDPTAEPSIAHTAMGGRNLRLTFELQRVGWIRPLGQWGWQLTARGVEAVAAGERIAA